MAEVTVKFRRVFSLTMKSQEHNDGYWELNDDSIEELKQDASNRLHGNRSPG